MLILTGNTGTELIVKNSRFLAELTPVKTQAEARETIKLFKQKYADATHVVHAFITGNNAEIMGMSDDGEPAGTAGRPVMDVLKGRGVTNVILTVTRWFGGTLLGTGGLVKAYGDAAKLVLDKAAEENLLEENIPKDDFTFSVPYELYDKLKYSLKKLHIHNMNEQFDSKIIISGQIETAEKDILAEMVTNLTNGKESVSFIS